MPGYYTYLISSLPMLHFGTRPLLNLRDFLNRCLELISEQDVKLIKKVISTDAYDLDITSPGILLKWKQFDLALRNELVKARSIRKRIDAVKFLRKDIDFDINITQIVQASLRQTSILEAEKFLDLERWKVLDELSSGHYFDLDFLLVYALKLAMLERWDKINSADKPELLKKVLAEQVN